MNQYLTLLPIAALCSTVSYGLPYGGPHRHNDHMGFIDLAETSMVEITSNDDYIIISSNAIPNHVTGAFPNAGNPNSISPQNIRYRITRHPVKNAEPTEHPGQIGIAINGVPFEPGTAECYNGQKRSPVQSCDWREEAIVLGQSDLGLDQSNAHVQPTGLYHYHGIPTGLVALDTVYGDDLMFVGYAADGFKLLVSQSNKYKSSYTLKKGNRPSGPGGPYTGKYTQDFMYVEGSGDLDACNGFTFPDGSYAYVLTDTFPFVPRCLYGTADESFTFKGI